MPADIESDVRKTIDLTVQTSRITEDILKSCMQQFLTNSATKKGKMSINALQKKNGAKLESIAISEANIRSFLETAKKYDVDFALKRDRTTEPATYHVLFSSSKTENIKRAFTEYADKKRCSIEKPQRGETSRSQLRKEAREAAKQPRKRERTRERSKEVSH